MVNDMTLGTKKNKDSKFNKEIPINKLRNIGYLEYRVFIDTLDTDNNTLYVVKIGPINNEETIKYVQRKLKKDEIDSKITN